MELSAEQRRLEAYRLQQAKWKKWGPYVSDRAWGTVREDYSEEENPWVYSSYDTARLRAYRWNEDGLGGICDRFQRICLGLSLWNGKDPILKERLFGLTNPEGNHGEDVKEYYFYLDNTPTHSYMKMLYKYPQGVFPYQDLIEKNRNRGQQEKEFELVDTGIFKENCYFDVFIEYAKENEEDLLLRYTICNRAKEPAECFVLPTLWFRNTWSWGYSEKGATGDENGKPELKKIDQSQNISTVEITHPIEGQYFLYALDPTEVVFTENETNTQTLYGTKNTTPYVKDAFHRYLINKEKEAINPEYKGTKCASIHHKQIPSEGQFTVMLRFSKKQLENPFKDFDSIFSLRQQEADIFYQNIQPTKLKKSVADVQRQAFAGLLWNKQFYYLDVEQWRLGDPIFPLKRKKLRNGSWEHLTTFDILSMPDKWEYPYFCAWDTAFHAIPLLLIDPDFAKRQIELLTREWYLHPNGQLPSYEWNFSDVNPPVLAWSAWRAFKIDQKKCGTSDKNFIKGVFNKLLMNFTWWVNRKDEEGNNVFQGGFLGLDNISVFDRSATLPTGGHIDQSDGTAWMGFYCTTMLHIAMHLSLEEPVYQDIATKFFEHFLRISQAMNNCGGKGHSLWNEEDGFFYDVLHLPNDQIIPLKVRSLVGLLPLLAVETIQAEMMEKLPIFSRRVDWFVHKHPHAQFNISCVYHPGVGHRRLMAILTKERLLKVLKYLLDENEFLSEYGIRSLSKYHEKHPYTFRADGKEYTVGYVPGESDNRLFGGNSNWKGPIWFPMNFLIIESLQKYHHYYGDEIKVEFPTGSNHFLNLKDVAKELSKRLIRLFLEDKQGKRPFQGSSKVFEQDPYFKDYTLFNEYFHGDTGEGLGATHQTGWTALVAKLIQQIGEEI